jgi:DNA-binding transcriptional LysR family regulator
MFELSQLRCFIVVAQELHFGRAANRLSMTQPPLSRQIRALEEQVGVQLLERNSRTVHLTAAGKAFFFEAVQILRAAEQASFKARRIAEGEQGALSIGFTSASGYGLLPQVVRGLRERLPGIVLSLKEMNSTSQVDALNAGQLDIGLMRPHHLNEELDSVILLREHLMLALPAEEAERWPAQPTFACLDGKPFIMYAPFEARPFHDMLKARFDRAGVVPDIVEYVGQVHTMLALVGAGMGTALVAASAARLQFKNVVVRPVATEPVETIGVWRRDNENPALQLLRREILSNLTLG